MKICSAAAGVFCACTVGLPTRQPPTNPIHSQLRRPVAQQPQHREFQPLEEERCTFNEENRLLILNEGGQSHVAHLNTPIAAGGRYLGPPLCGEQRTLMITESLVIVTLGKAHLRSAHLRSGRTTLPSEYSDSLVIPHDRALLNSQPVAWTAGNEGELLFLLGKNGRIASNDVTVSGDGFATFDIPEYIELLTSSRSPQPRPQMHHYRGHTFIFRPGSRQIIDVSDFPSDTEVPLVARHTLQSECPNSPTFEERGDVLIADWGRSQLMVSIDGTGTTIIAEVPKE